MYKRVTKHFQQIPTSFASQHLPVSNKKIISVQLRNSFRTMYNPAAKHFYRPQTKLRKGNVFTSVSHSVHRGVSASVHAGIHTAPLMQVHSPGKNTPLGRYTPPMMVTAADGTHPTGMLSCYRLQTKLWKGNAFTSVCQEFCPQDGCLPQCMLGYTTPPWADTALGRRLLQRTVRILLECILVQHAIAKNIAHGKKFITFLRNSSKVT